MNDELKKLAERIDNAMRDHAYSHKISNSPYNFFCSPSCVSQQLQIVIEREVGPLQDIKDVLHEKFPLWNGTAEQLKEIVDGLERSYSDT